MQIFLIPSDVQDLPRSPHFSNKVVATSFYDSKKKNFGSRFEIINFAINPTSSTSSFPAMVKGVLREVNKDAETLPHKKRQPKAVEKVVVAEKENTPILRRSKRKITTALEEEKNNATSTVKVKTIKSSSRSVQSTKTRSKKSTLKSTTKCSISVLNDHSANLSQNKLNFSPLKPIAEDADVSKSTIPVKNELIISPLGVSEDSGFESSTRVSDQSSRQSVVFHSPVVKCSTASDKETCILTCEIPPLSYWKDLAEQRRISLEKALQENESLHDQLAVLEAENSQLKQLVKQAEEFAEIVKGAIK